MTEQDLLKMPLHDIKIIKKDMIWIIRVPGGWIYYFQQSISRDSYYPNGIPSTVQVSVTSTFVPEPRPLTVDYPGYEEWLKSQEEQYPEPEPNQSDVDEARLLTLGHY